MVASSPSTTVILGALNKSVPCFLFNALINKLACDPPKIILPAPAENCMSVSLDLTNGLTPAPISTNPGKTGAGVGIFILATGLRESLITT